MSNATPSRLGSANGGSDKKALFEKVSMGEVLTAFETSTVLKGLTRQRNITSGKSASFPAMFKAGGGYHTPGEELLGRSVLHNEVIIPIDDLLVSDIFVANIDEAMNHYEVRQEYTRQQGLFLALEYDKNIARNLIRSARGAALFTGDTGGSTVVDSDADSSATSLAGSIWASKQGMEEKDVPVEMTAVNAAVRPAQWYLLAQEPTLILNSDVGGDGSYSQGKFHMIGGVDVIKSNAFPWGTDDSSNTELPSDYRVDMSDTVASVFTEAAVGTVQLMGLGYEVAPDARRRGTLMIAEYSVGHGPILTKAATEIATA
tara:strand:- start:5212 stop:6159 length:948 start_codon:yes stop_codon:yes gene_type:complete